MPKPAPTVDDDWSTALPLGRESMYSLVNIGTQADADALLSDVWRIPRFAEVRLPGGPRWTEDPFDEMYWRFNYYSLRPTSNLLWAFYRTGRTEYRDKLLSILRGYLDHIDGNPPLWSDGMDDPHAVAFRGMVLVNTYTKLRRSGDLPATLAPRLRSEIDRIAGQLERPENFEGHYNHGFTQAAALLLIAANFPELRRSPARAALSRQRLAELMHRIIDPDGVENEQSPFYHFYVLDFMLEVQRWAATHRVALPPGFGRRIDDMARYAAAIIWPDGQVPVMGSSVQMRADRSLPLYRGLMKRFPHFAYAVTAGRQGTPPAQRAVAFPYSGQVVLRSAADPGDPAATTQLLMSVGGMVSAHSHQEALAFSYYSQGRELLPDSGMFTYSMGPAKDYFFGTTAHNTVTVDGRNQDGDYRDHGPVRAGRTLTGPGWAYQSGEARVYRGVAHRRSTVLLDRDLVLVVDHVASSAPHTYRQLWHLFPGARPIVRDGTAEVLDEYDNPALRITQAAPGVVERAYGDTEPMQGWHSPAYGVSRPNHVIAYVAKTRATRWYTLIGSGRYAGLPARVTPRTRGTLTTVRVCVGDEAPVVRIAAQAQPGERVEVARTGGCADG